MKQRLDLPFDCRNEADTNFEIAAHYIEQGDWEIAFPYSEAAAIRGDDWMYRQTAWLNALLGDKQWGLEWMEQALRVNDHGGVFTYILSFEPVLAPAAP